MTLGDLISVIPPKTAIYIRECDVDDVMPEIDIFVCVCKADSPVLKQYYEDRKVVKIVPGYTQELIVVVTRE